MPTFLLVLFGLFGLALYALIKIDLRHLRIDLRAWPIKLLIDISSTGSEQDLQPESLHSHPTCYQPFGGNPGSVVVAHAVCTDDPDWSVAGEPLSGRITMEEWPGQGPACPACESALSRHHADHGAKKISVFSRRRQWGGLPPGDSA
jgi:hypothetical protein